jgi:hypothetical protein
MVGWLSDSTASGNHVYPVNGDIETTEMSFSPLNDPSCIRPRMRILVFKALVFGIVLNYNMKVSALIHRWGRPVTSTENMGCARQHKVKIC